MGEKDIVNIQQVIQNMYPNLSSKEKDIARFLLSNSKNIMNINISKLADLTYTSPSTITRFSKKIGCDNFVDLKIKLHSTDKLEVEEKKEKQSVFEYYSDVINQTEEITDINDIEAVIQLIKEARKIFVFGVGSSGLTAMEFSQRLLRMGLNSTGISDSHLMLITSSIVRKGDLVIGISTSGETKEVIDALELAKKNEANILGITCFSKSELSNIVDLSVNAYSSLFINNRNFINSQFSIMYQIDKLSIMLLEDERLNNNMKQTVTVLFENEREDY